MVWQEANCIKEAFHFGKENRRSQSYYRIPLSCIGFTGAYIKRYAEERESVCLYSADGLTFLASKLSGLAELLGSGQSFLSLSTAFR